ncbi:MAG: hypothetical protein JO349_06355 [Candidatus Eremiobacteraeota bacterium]|nr:hypothetical protein [Candidatus Eremiobacteraeota bacterium]
MTAVVPERVPDVLLVALEIVAVLAFGTVRKLGAESTNPLLLCTRCIRLHERAEVFGRLADAAATGALAFLVALPFVAAMYESGFTLLRAVLAASAVVAALAIAAEADSLVRSGAERILPHFRWNAEPTRILGGGARWLGLMLAFYMFKAGYNGGGGTALGMVGLFGDVGKRLALDLSSTSVIWAAASILVVAQIVSLLSRWLIPLVFNSVPMTLAARREPRRTS